MGKKNTSSLSNKDCDDCNNKGNCNNEPDEFVFHMTEESLKSYVITKNLWLSDTGSQSHIVHNQPLFTQYTKAPDNIQGARNCPSLECSDIRIYFNAKSDCVPITLKNTVHVFSVQYNLKSLG